MSKFDQNLFGRIAVLSNFLTQEQLQDCLDYQKSQSARIHIGHILLERGYLTSEQFDRILDIRRKKIRKLLTDPDEARESDREFGALVLKEGFLNLNQLEDAVLEQQRLKRLNLRFSISEVLVSRGDLTRAQVWDIQTQQEKRVLGCPVCDGHFRIVEFDAERVYSCPRCSHEGLVPPPFLDSMLVDAVLDTENETELAAGVGRAAESPATVTEGQA